MEDNSHIVKSFFKQVNKSVENKTSTMTQIKSAIVDSVNVDGTVNITIPPSEIVYHNIQNQSIYRNLKPGDNVKIIKEGNSLSNMWIMGGFGLEARTEITSDQSALWQGDFSKTLATIESTAKANSAKIKSLASWQSQVYTDVANIAEIRQQANNNGASISLIVEGVGVNGKIKAASIIQSINNQGETNTKIEADKVDFAVGDYSIDANKINFTTDDFSIIANGINLSGYVTFNSLETEGNTIINGSNIKTGLIKSANYVANTSGTSINLADGVVDNKYFKLNSDGGQFGDDDLYITIGENARGYDTLFLKTKRDGNVVENNLEIWRTIVNLGTDDEYNSVYIGGNNGITLGLMRSNSPSEDPTPIIDMSFNGNTLYGKWNIDQDQIWSHNLGTTKGFTLESSLEIPNADRDRVYRYGSLYKDNLYYTSINTDESSGLRLRCKDVIGVQMTNSSGTVSGTLMGSWYLNSKEIATVSDRNIKTNIINVNDNYNDLFDNLSPILYQYNDGTSQIYIGFVAQDVEQAAEDAGISLNTFGVVARNEFIDDEGNNVKRVYLHYNNFIALNTWQIQKLKSRVTDLESRIEALEQK